MNVLDKQGYLSAGIKKHSYTYIMLVNVKNVTIMEIFRFKNIRELQDSNLRGQSPSDFESDSLTTRTNSRLSLKHF